MLTQIMREGDRGQGTGDSDILDCGLELNIPQSAIRNPKTRNSPLSPTYDSASNALKLPVQVVASENERSWPAVRAMMLVLGQVPLGKK